MGIEAHLLMKLGMPHGQRRPLPADFCEWQYKSSKLKAKDEAVDEMKQTHACYVCIDEALFETTFTQLTYCKFFRFCEGFQRPSLNRALKRAIRGITLVKN